MSSRFGNYGSAVAVTDQNAGCVLQSKNALRSGDIFLERCLRLLDDADVVAIVAQDVVNAFPAGTICPGAVNQNNIPNAMVLVVVIVILRRDALRRQVLR